jgi:hypothetical protein
MLSDSPALAGRMPWLELQRIVSLAEAARLEALAPPAIERQNHEKVG